MAVLLGGLGSAAYADNASPVGAWRTIDDATHQPKAIVRIVQRDGTLFGIVEKSLVEKPAHKTCDDCADDRKGKPILGMEIIRGLKPDGDHWGGGTILDPETGKVYDCKVTLQDGGAKLSVRGFMGMALFGRSQVWERAE
jgi:uncharacterized protein (DUF2147 family)